MGRLKGLSGMQGNLLVPFLEGLEAAMPPGYSASGWKRARERATRWPPILPHDGLVHPTLSRSKQAAFQWIGL